MVLYVAMVQDKHAKTDRGIAAVHCGIVSMGYKYT